MADFFEGEGLEPQAPKKKKQVEDDFFEGEGAPAQAISGDFFEGQGADFFEDSGEPTAPEKELGRQFEGAVALNDDELQQIAVKNGVNAQELRDLAPYFGVVTPNTQGEVGLGQMAKEGVGFLGRAALFGLPQGAYKKLQGSEGMRRALDEIQQIHSKHQSGLDMAAELAAGLVTGGAVAKGAGSALKAFSPRAAEAVATKGGALATSAGLGAAVGGLNASEGSEAQGALIGGALGGAAHGLAGAIAKKLGSKAAARVAPEIEAEVAEAAQKNSARLLKEADELEALAAQKAGKRDTSVLSVDDFFEEAAEIESRVVGQADEQLTKDFADYLKSSDVQGAAKSAKTAEAVDTLAAKYQELGPELFKREVNNFQLARLAEERMAEKLVSQLPREASTLNAAKTLFLDGREVGRQIDTRLGTAVEPAMDQVSKAGNRATSDIAREYVESKPVLEALQRELPEVDVQLIKALEQRGLKGVAEGGALAPAQVEALTAFEQYLTKGENSLSKKLTKAGLPIREIAESKAKFYVPKLAVDSTEVPKRIANMAREAGIEAQAGVTGQQLRRVGADIDKTRALTQLKEGVAFVTGRTAEELQDANVLSLALKEAITPGSIDAATRKRVGAQLARSEEGVPDFLRETNLNKLLARYISTTFRAARMNPAISELIKQRNFAQAAKDFDAANYLTKVIKDIQGGRSSTFAGGMQAATKRFVSRAKTLADAAPEGSKERDFYGLLAEMPELGSYLSRQIYPNFLGLNPKSVIQNLTQSLMGTAPELGTGYGGALVVKNLMKTLLRPDKLASGAVERELVGKGQMAHQWTQDMVEAMQGGIQKTALQKMPVELLNKFTNFSMKLFELSEQLNRKVAVGTAADMAKDLFTPSRSEKALNTLKNFGPAYRRNIQTALERGDEQGARTLIEDYIVGKTLFHYNKATMSEFGRSMGPIFSVFSKWPSAIAGDIASQFQERGVFGGTTRVAQKYMAPMVLLAYLDQILGTKDNEAVRPYVGKNGLQAMAPIGSLGPIAEGKGFQPPSLQLATHGLKAVLGMDSYEAWRFFNEATAAYMPGSLLLRIAGSDIPKYQGDAQSGTLLGKVAKQFGYELDEQFKTEK